MRSQRATWIRIAREFGALAWIAVFDTPYEVGFLLLTQLVLIEWLTITRYARSASKPVRGVNPLRYNIADQCYLRYWYASIGSGHPTLKNPEMALGILKRFSSDYRAPEAHEGYDKIAYFKPEDLPSLPYTHDSLVAVLEQIRLSEKK
jgi:hypothetical protein